jgi:hypothetical protein
MINKRHNFFSATAIPALIFGLVVLGGCSTTQTATSIQPTGKPAVSSDTSVNQHTAKSVKQSSFPSETLFDLLVAEMAGDRQEYGLSLAIYTKQAHATRDPNIVQRATLIAVMLNANLYAVDLSTLWVELKPNNIEANRIAAYYLGHAGQLNQAFPHAIFMLQHGEANLLRNLATFSAQATSQVREQLLNQYDQLPPELAHNNDVLLTKATILWQQNEIT